MEILGWLVLFIPAVWLTGASFAAIYGSIIMSGKIEAECWFLVALAAAFVFGAYHFWPFIVQVKP